MGILQPLLHRLRKIASLPLWVNAYALVASNLLVAGSSYLFWMIAARRFNVELVGIATAQISAMALLNALTNLGLEASIIRFLPPALEQRQDSSQLILTTLAVRLPSTLLAGVIFIAGAPWLAPGLSAAGTRPAIWITFLTMVIVNGIFQLFNAVFIAYRHAAFILLPNVLFNLLKVAIVLLIPTHIGLLGLLTTVALPLAITVGLEVIWGLPRVGLNLRISPQLICRAELGNFFKYSAASQVTDTLLSAPQMLLPLLVVNTLGPEANAYFYISWMTASMLRTASMSVAQSTFAEGAASRSAFGRNLKHSILINLMVVGFGAGGLLIVGPYLLHLFGQDYSRQGVSLLNWQLLSVDPFSLFLIILTVQRVYDRMKLLMILPLIWASLSIGGFIVGIETGGLIGASIGWTVGQFVCLAASAATYCWTRSAYRPANILSLPSIEVATRESR